MSLSSLIEKQATAGDANAAATACLPQDVLASILVRLPASDLRRFRRVCKEWRAVISDPAFINDHMVHGPRTLNHTIVFVPGQPYGTKHSDNGSGFMFDDQWRLTATFSTPRFDVMIGQCNGLLCFLDGRYRTRTRTMHMVDPFTGKSLTLPMAPRTELRREHVAYCFGFDPSSRRFKIFHRGKRYNVTKQDLYVYTIGVGENWRRVQVDDETLRGVYHGDPVFANGSVYWYIVTGHHARLARFDLATEKITSEPIYLATGGAMSESIEYLHEQMGASLPIMTEEVTSESIAFLQDTCVHLMKTTLPNRRHLARPHALQRDQLLLNDYHDGGLYAHTIAPASNDLGCGKLLLGMKDERPASCTRRGLFVPVHVNQRSAAVAKRSGYTDDRRARVFWYAPPVSPAPLSHYFGEVGKRKKSLGVPKISKQ